MQETEKKQLLEAIDGLGRRVTAADVAAKTGLPLNVVTPGLNLIASETGGHLQVATTGDIAYSFAPGFQTRYIATGIKRVLQQIGSKAFEIGFFLLRISFGIMLILSLLIIVLALIVISMAGRGDNDRDGGFDFDFIDWMIVRDLFWYSSWYTPYDTVAYNQPYSRQRPRQKGNFFLNVFSFLFGDGNPNAHIDERRWQHIPQLIRRHNGVVTAEQLGPFIGSDSDDAMLPVLVRFDGRPEVTETGNIMYVFPSLQVSAAEHHDQLPPAYLHEWPWKFTNLPGDSLVWPGILAIINFFGAWWLLMTVITMGMYGLLPLAVILVTYGTLFVVVPGVRWMVLQSLNASINARNKERATFAENLLSPSEELAKKLVEARDYQIKEQQLTADKIVYTTEKDALDQKDALEEQFDRLEADQQKQPSHPSQHDASEQPDSGAEPKLIDSDKDSIKLKLDREAIEKEFDASP